MQKPDVRHALCAALLALVPCRGTAAPAPAGPGGAAGIRHEMILVDESRSQLIYVNQGDPARNWSVKMPGRGRDFQLVGARRLLVSMPDGYCEFSLTDGALLEKTGGFGGVVAARRRPNGHTILARNTKRDGKPGVEIIEADGEGKAIRKVFFDQFSNTRLMRVTTEGTFLTGANQTFVEADWNGKILRRIAPQKARHTYMIVRLADGTYWAATGYGGTVQHLDASGKVLRTVGGDEATRAARPHFFASFQLLPNGHVVVSNWQGHKPEDSRKGVGVLEYDADGKLVWTYNDPEAHGSLHGVLILDGLDTTKLHDATTGRLRAVIGE